jgi:hypothetical protein
MLGFGGVSREFESWGRIRCKCMYDTKLNLIFFLSLLPLFPSKGKVKVDDFISFGMIAILPSCKIFFGTRRDHRKFEM